MHQRDMPLADPKLIEALMEEAREFVDEQTSIKNDTSLILSEHLGRHELRLVTEYVRRMSIFSVAEREARRRGLTLRDWTKEQA